MPDGEASYRSAWDGFWRDVAGTTGEVFWDSEPADAVERELPVFASQMDPALPLAIQQPELQPA